MAAFPGPKTNPSVMQLPSTNQRDLRERRISLGPIQVAALIGLFTGCLAVAFYIGFFSGQKVGTQAALDSNLPSTTMPLPIEPEDERPRASADESATSDVYAKLGDSGKEQKSSVSALLPRKEKEPQMPEIGSIQDLGSAPIQIPEELSVEKKDPPAGSLPNVRVLGGKSAQSDEEKTLGDLARGASPTEADVPPAAVPEPTVPPAPTKAPPTKAPEQEVKNVKPQRERDEGFIRTVIPKGWFAQIAAPKSQAEAETIARKLKSSGFEVIIENALVRNQNYYRILVGPEEDRLHAERLIGQLKREPYIKSEPFLRMVR